LQKNLEIAALSRNDYFDNMKNQKLLSVGAAFAAALSFASAQDPQGQPQLTPEQQEQLQKAIQQFQTQPAQPELPKMSKEEAIAYFSRNIGVQIGSQLKQDEVILKEEFLKGLNDAIAGKEDIKAIDMLKMQAAEQIVQEVALEKMKEKGVKFLAENKTKEGVKVTASGLQYKVIKEGEGESPTSVDQVTVHYTGKLVNGTVFDSSVERGEPATFGVTGVIQGWIEGLQLMKPGAKYEFVIPSELAYGENGQSSIPPHSTLIFEVELMKVIKPQPPEAIKGTGEKLPEPGATSPSLPAVPGEPAVTPEVK
jgi:FKBP-type peptidyl-prolyl cis-trans isomerase FkpA